MSFSVSTVVSTGPSESKRDVDHPWFALMQAIGDGTCSSERGIAEATRSLDSSGDARWGLPLALAYWSQKRYEDCCNVLNRKDVSSSCSHSFLYFNLLGMSVRHLHNGEVRARNAYEKALEIDPLRADTLYNLANLVKDDDQERADDLYFRSILLL